MLHVLSQLSVLLAEYSVCPAVLYLELLKLTLLPDVLRTDDGDGEVTA
jgi:hypothetical protein